MKLRIVYEITSRFILRLAGALLRCSSLIWNNQTALRASRTAFRQAGLNREVISYTILRLLILDLLICGYMTIGNVKAEESHIGQPEAKQLRGDRQVQRKEKISEKLRQADTNQDRAISREEAEKGLPHLAKHFDKIDENHDGLITPEELRHFREKRMQHRIDRGRSEPRLQ